MTERSKKTVIENEYVTLLIDSACLILINFEFEVLCNNL